MADKRQVLNTRPEFISDETQVLTIPLSISPNISLNRPNNIQLNDCINFKSNSNEELNNLFDSWKSKLEQFKLLMQIKHNNYGFSWCDSIMLQNNSQNLNKLDFIRFGRSSRLRETIKNFKSSSIDLNNNNLNKKIAKIISNNKNKISKLVERKKSSIIIRSLEKKIGIDNERSASLVNEPDLEISKIAIDYTDLKLDKVQNGKFDQKATNLISQEEISKFDDPKTISSIISDNFTLVNPSNIMAQVINPCCYFNLLPVSPSICHHYTTTNYFNQNEINVANILVSNVDTSVEELFCEDLRIDNEISI